MADQGRILLDSPPDLDPAPVIDFLSRLDYPVDVCHGPAHGELCPILAGEGCDKVAHATGIIFHLDLERPQHRAILREYQRQVPPDIPIRVVVQPGQERTYADLLRGLMVWDHSPSPADLDGFAAMVEASEVTRETVEP